MGKIEYKLQPMFGGKANEFMIELDRKHRAKVEKAAGKPFTDEEWFKYKMMTIPKSKYQK